MKKFALFLFLALSLCFGQYRIVEIDDVTHFFDADGDSTVQTINSSSGFLILLEVQNMNLADAWIQIFDASSPTVGTTTPDFSFHVPGGDGIEYWGSKTIYFSFPGVVFETAIKYACTTTATGSTNPTTGLIINAQYFDD